MLAGQEPVIHFPSHQYIALERPLERDRSTEIHLCSLLRTTIRADKFNVFRSIVDPDKIENIS